MFSLVQAKSVVQIPIRDKLPQAHRYLCPPENCAYTMKFIAVNKKNEVHIVDSKGGNVHVFTLLGAKLRITDPQTRLGANESFIKINPEVAAMSPSGNYLAVMELLNDKRVIVYTQTAALQFMMRSETFFPWKIAIDYDDNLVILESPQGHNAANIKRYSIRNFLADVESTRLQVHIASQSSIAVGRDRSIYVSDRQKDIVFKFSPQGNFLNTIGGPKTTRLPKKVMVTDENYVVVIADIICNCYVTVFNDEALLIGAYELEDYVVDTALTKDCRLVVLGWPNYYCVYSLECLRNE